MAAIFYHASHEQFSPSQLLQWVRLAEKAGFAGIHSSDHFHPWSLRQGHSGYSFSWLGAAMQSTSLPFSMVCAPGQRYHPAIVAQAIATLAEMFPGRLHVELGSGEALNEMITGEAWPSKKIRNERLLECFHILKKLLSGEEVTYKGHVQIKEAKIYTLPPTPPLLLCAAISVETAAWAGSWAEGLLTTAGEPGETSDKISAFRKNGGVGKPIYLQYAFSYSSSEEDAIIGAYDQWRSNVTDKPKLSDLYKPEHFDDAAKDTTIEDVKEAITMITNMDDLMKELEPFAKMGVDRIILHNVNRQQEKFINDYGIIQNAKFKMQK